MKKILASLFAMIGVAAIAQPQPKVVTMDPKAILFSIPTLSGDIPPLEPASDVPKDGDLIIHEDDWTQVEFFAKARLAELKRVMTEYKRFEQANRAQNGWRKPYVRKIERSPIIDGTLVVKQLETTLAAKVGSAPRLSSAGTVYNRLKDSFTVPLGGNVVLYGRSVGQSVLVLAASVGRNPDDFKLTQAFMKLNASHGLILIDWRSQLVLVSVTSKGEIETWSP
jgi:hypothetical protein